MSRPKAELLVHQDAHLTNMSGQSRQTKRKNRKDEQITSASAPQSYTNLVISEEGVLCPWYRARLAQRRAFMSLNSHVINRVPRLVHTCDDCNDGYYPDINDDRNKFLKLFTNFIMEMKDQLCNKQESSKDSHSFENGDKYLDGKHYPYLGEKNDAQTSTMLPLMNTKEGIDWQPTSSSISTHFVSTEAPNNDKLQTSPSLQSIQSTTNHTKDNSMDNVSLSSASQQSNDEMSDQSVLSSVLVQTSSDSLSSTEPTPASNTTEDEMVEQPVLSSDSTQPSSDSLSSIEPTPASNTTEDEMVEQQVLSSDSTQPSSDSLSSTEPTPASNTTEDEMVEQPVLSSDSIQPSSDSLSSTKPTPASNTTEDKMVDQQVPSSASTQPSSSSSSATEPTPASQQFNDEMSDQSVLSSVLVQPSSSSSSYTEPMPTSNTTENKMVDQQVLSSASTQPSSDSLSSTKPTPASNTTEDEMVEQPVLKSAPAQPSSDSLSSTEPTPTSLSNQKLSLQVRLVERPAEQRGAPRTLDPQRDPPSEADSFYTEGTGSSDSTPATPVKTDSEARDSFDIDSLSTPDVLAQPDFGHVTRLASQAPRETYARWRAQTMATGSNQDMAFHLQALQESVDTMQVRFDQIMERFGSTAPAAETPAAGGANLFTAGPPPTTAASAPVDSWASLEPIGTPRLAATEDQALRLALAAKAKSLELQPGRNSHELKFLLGMMANYQTMSPDVRQKLLHRLNLVFIAVTQSWAEAVNAAGDAASAAIYPPGYQPIARPQIIYRERPQPRAPRGRGAIARVPLSLLRRVLRIFLSTFVPAPYKGIKAEGNGPLDLVGAAGGSQQLYLVVGALPLLRLSPEDCSPSLLYPYWRGYKSERKVRRTRRRSERGNPGSCPFIERIT
uniref:Uncharacterized protein n=1 Tax=Timema tahoe TaxID=61484 RepID=A0A7R9IMH9_9NEOP|nr:unnamed protein product [Timema tahoe]